MIVKILRGWIILLFDWENIHFISVVIGAFVYIVYGAIYYSILLSNKKDMSDREHTEIQSKGPFKYIYSIIIAFISSFFMALIIQASGTESLYGGLTIGLMIGLLITFVYIKNALFGLLSRKTLLIAIGDHLVIFTILGGIHGF